MPRRLNDTASRYTSAILPKPTAKTCSLTGGGALAGRDWVGAATAVEARSAGWYGNNRLCPGDSGGPWAFSVGGAEDGEKFAFGLSGGTWKRSNPFLGGNYWAVLIRPKLFWITDVAAEKGVPIKCPRLDDLGSYYLYRQCSEGYWMASRSASDDPVRLRSEATTLSDVAFADFNALIGTDEMLAREARFQPP